MNELQIFNNPEFGEIRAIEIKGEPWLIGKDVTTILGYQNGSRDINRHVEEEDRLIERVFLSGQNRETIFINESGLYSLILSSKLPTAKKFRHWVTSEVLPSIRKHGMYAIDQLIDDPDLAIKAFTALKEERDKRRALEEKVEMDRPKVVFADAVAGSNTSILIGDLAKLLRQNGINMGQNRLFSWLREKEYLIRRNGSDYNLPTQKSMEMGLFEIKETTIKHSDGHTSINRTTKVTGKGQQYFINLFLG